MAWMPCWSNRKTQLAFAEATLRVLGRPYLAESLANNARLSAERYTWTEVRSGLARLYGIQADALARDRDELPDDVLARTEFLLSDPLTRPPVEDELPDPPYRRRARR